MIKYIGSKRRLIPLIAAVVEALPGVDRVLDLFSGTSRVGRALKERGYEVVANDHNTYAWVLARCFVQADGERVQDEARRLALEMALHEEQERRALEGELKVLEAAWKAAEEIAEISDNLLLPEGTNEFLEQHGEPRDS